MHIDYQRLVGGLVSISHTAKRIDRTHTHARTRDPTWDPKIDKTSLIHTHTHTDMLAQNTVLVH